MIKINSIGDECPVPVIKASKALKNTDATGIVLISVDNRIAVQNLQKMAGELGCSFSVEEVAKNHYDVTLIRNDAATGTGLSREYYNALIFISSAEIGRGNDELGAALMKSFLFALSETPRMPKAILFCNGGIILNTKSSPCLKDIQKLEEAGVKVYTCDTSLKAMGLSRELGTGEAIGMRQITDIISQSVTIFSLS